MAESSHAEQVECGGGLPFVNFVVILVCEYCGDFVCELCGGGQIGTW